MSKYSAKTFWNDTMIETYENRSRDKIISALQNAAKLNGPSHDGWGNPLKHINRVVVTDSYRRKIFEGSLAESVAFMRTQR